MIEKLGEDARAGPRGRRSFPTGGATGTVQTVPSSVLRKEPGLAREEVDPEQIGSERVMLKMIVPMPLFPVVRALERELAQGTHGPAKARGRSARQRSEGAGRTRAAH